MVCTFCLFVAEGNANNFQILEKFTANHQQQNHYHQVFFRSGIVAVIGEWLNTNCEEPVEKIVRIIEAHLNCMNAIDSENKSERT